MTWKKLLVGGAGSALLIGSAVVSLTDCTVCNGPQCFNDTDSGGKDSATEAGNDSGPATCSAIKPTGKVYWDNAQGTGPCDKCMSANCCAPVQGCLADKGVGDGSTDTCASYIDCLDTCGTDTVCVNACKADPNNAMGKAKYQNDVLLGCMYVKCGVSCMVSDAGM